MLRATFDRQQGDHRVDELLGVGVSLVPYDMTAQLQIRCAVGGGQEERFVASSSNPARSRPRCWKAGLGEDGVSAESAAKVIARAAAASRPRTRYTIGRDAAILVRLAGLLSDRFLDRVVRLNLRSHFAVNA